MPLPELTLTFIGWIVLVYIIGFISGEVIPWFFRAWLGNRQERRDWYADVSSAAGRAGNLFPADTEFDTIDLDTVEELNTVERELSDLVTTDLGPDKEILSDAKELRVHISQLTNFLVVQGATKDKPLVLPEGVGEEGSETWKIRKTVDGIKSLSFRLNNNAVTKAKDGYYFLGIRI